MSTIANALSERASAATERRALARAAQFAAIRKGETALQMGGKNAKVVLPGHAVVNTDGSITMTLAAPKDTDIRTHDSSDCVTYSVDFRDAIKLRAGDYVATFSASRPVVLNVFIGDPCGDPTLAEA